MHCRRLQSSQNSAFASLTLGFSVAIGLDCVVLHEQGMLSGQKTLKVRPPRFNRALLSAPQNWSLVSLFGNQSSISTGRDCFYNSIHEVFFYDGHRQTPVKLAFPVSTTRSPRLFRRFPSCSTTTPYFAVTNRQCVTS